MTPQTFSCFKLDRVEVKNVFVVVLFCLVFSFCQIALAFLFWMLITVGFYFGLQKITKTKNRASFNSAFALNIKAIFYANNTTYFISLLLLLLLLLFIYLFIYFYFFFWEGAFLFCFCCCCYDITLKSPSL